MRVTSPVVSRLSRGRATQTSETPPQPTPQGGGRRLGTPAAVFRSADSGVPGVGAQDQRGRPVVDQPDLHQGPKGAGLHDRAGGAYPLDEAVDERPAYFGPSRLEEPRPVLA